MVHEVAYCKLTNNSPETNKDGLIYVQIDPLSRKRERPQPEYEDNDDYMNDEKIKRQRPMIDIDYINEHNSMYRALEIPDESGKFCSTLIIRKMYPKLKSLYQSSVIHAGYGVKTMYWNSLGRCRLSSKKFRWIGEVIAYNATLGRAYYSCFEVFQNNKWDKFSVGDFVWRRVFDEETHKLTENTLEDDYDLQDWFCKHFRIIGIYQALKSYRGFWSQSDQDIQKRGHPYMIVCPLYPLKKFNRRLGARLKYNETHNKFIDYMSKWTSNTDDIIDLALPKIDKETLNRNFILPLWIGEPDVIFQKFEVDTVCEGRIPSKSTIEKLERKEKAYICFKELTIDFLKLMTMKRAKKGKFNIIPLDPKSVDILITDNPMMHYSSQKWPEKFDAEHIEYIHVDRRYKLQLSHLHFDSSDDSDDFDCQSEKLKGYLGFSDEDEASNIHEMEYSESDNYDEISIDDNIKDTEDLQRLKASNTKELIQAYYKDQDQRNDYSEILVRLAVDGELEANPSIEAGVKNLESSKETVLKGLESIINKGLCEIGVDSMDNPYVKKYKELYKDVSSALGYLRPLSEIVDIQNPNLKDSSPHVVTAFVKSKISQKEVNNRKTTNDIYYNKADKLREELGYKEGFRYPQGHVCVSVIRGIDTIFIAPTGLGKSLCFAVPALYQGGITLVIEPLKAIIDDQVHKYRRNNRIHVEALRSLEDAQRFGEIRAEQRLCQIANNINQNSFKGPFILFCSAELASQERVLNQLSRIHRFRKLDRIVLDEFDVAGEATVNWREAYTSIIPTIRQHCPNIPFSLFSATTRKLDLLNLVKDLCENSNRGKPHIFFHERPIADSLSFSVERKESNLQVATRIAYIIESYEKMHLKTQEKPKCVCYCLTKSNCKKMSKIFNELGLKAEPATSENKNRHEIINRLKTGEIQIICATKVLSRGVDVHDIRFIFHTTMPTSLQEYVQETGRAGRDGKQSHCILFFREHDCVQAERVLRLKSLTNNKEILTGEERSKAARALNEVVNYAIQHSDHICRYRYLASYATVNEGEVASDKKCDVALCDICAKKKGVIFFNEMKDKRKQIVDKHKKVVANVRMETVDVTAFVKFFLDKFQKSSRVAGSVRELEMNKLFFEYVDSFNKSRENKEEKVPLKFNLGGFRKSLRNDLLRYLKHLKFIEIAGVDKDKCITKAPTFALNYDRLSKGKLTFKLLNVRKVFPVEKLLETVKKSEKQSVEIMVDSDDVESCATVELSNTISTELGESAKKVQQSQNDIPDLPFPLQNREIDISDSYHQNFALQKEILSNAQGLNCPRLKMPKEIVNMHIFKDLPFMVQFELYRLYNDKSIKNKEKFVDNVKLKLLDITWDWHNRYESCFVLNDIAGKTNTMWAYNHTLKVATESNIAVDEGPSGSTIFFSALFGEHGSDRITLLPPENAADRRIYRKFGSHRFLEVQIYSDVIKKHVLTFLNRSYSNPLIICGRKYSFLWGKAAKTPQAFVLFAESGIGINKAEEISVDSVREWCLCPKLNPTMTVAKEHKRMKLNFSKTTPAFVLPEQCLELEGDILGNQGYVMTDGCGRISLEAINAVWTIFKENDRKRSRYLRKNALQSSFDEATDHSVMIVTEDCPYTSFQGRCGGFKGMWVVDKSLQGIKLICKESQLKYVLPMKSYTNSTFQKICNDSNISVDQAELSYDDFYDTIEVCSWDKGAEIGKLNIRLIQILECRGASTEYFKTCADEGLEWMEKLKDGGSSSLLKLKSYHTYESRLDKTTGDMFDDDLIFRMAAVNVSRNEPVFSLLIEKRIRKEAEATRKKAKYPVPHCYQLRMIPDFTQILEENEAFIAGMLKPDMIEFEHVVAIRSPAYFAGDLLKLKLVSLVDLTKRGCAKGTDTSFFSCLHTGLVLSTLGDRSCADMMSGGDFDGDKAWVCFDPTLVSMITDHAPPLTNSSEFQIEKTEKENALAFKSSLLERLLFCINFRKHQERLGILSNTLDTVLDNFGFNSVEAKVIGRESFLQVDHPYVIREIPANIQKKLKNTSPHWKGCKNKDLEYRSTKALGILWDYVEEKIKAVKAHNDENYSRSKQGMNPHILGYIERAEERSRGGNETAAIYLMMLRRKMREAVTTYNLEISNYLSEKEDLSNLDVEFDPMLWSFMKSRHDYWRKKLFESLVDEELNLAASILYEQAWDLSLKKSVAGDEKVFKFAWYVCHDILTRIIGAGDACKRGRPLPVSIARNLEQDVIESYRKKG